MAAIHFLPMDLTVPAAPGSTLMEVMRDAGITADFPCGGEGVCGKCTVLTGGKEVLACQTAADTDMTVVVPPREELRVLRNGIEAAFSLQPFRPGRLLAIDIGTTSVVCFLLDETTGKELASASGLNAQTAFGADVISRIRAAMAGGLEKETAVIREELCGMIEEVCAKAGIQPSEIGVAAVVGNPAMQQLFLGISPENLAAVPFAPVLTEAKVISCGDILPVCREAALLIVPDIAGYIGADTMGCILSTDMYQDDRLTLMIDIGTNGEMVLGNADRMIACSTAAGPALEGANILFGMRGTEGAIDHVWLENGGIRCSVIGDVPAKGICGSGLIDAVAVLLEAELLNRRGRIQGGTERDGQRAVCLTENVWLTQEDIRQVQLAKGAICAGVQLMAQQLGHAPGDIERVLLAGAFGSFINPDSACRIHMIPEELQGRITAVGNAAGSGARMLACDRDMLARSQELAGRIEFLELASLPSFSSVFGRATGFRV